MGRGGICRVIRLGRVLSLVLCLAGAGAALAAEVMVAVAANLAVPMRKIAADFEAATGYRAVLAFGATGKFYAQISHGAPFQLLLAADDETPARLEREGFGLAGSRFTYAIGRLVLWSREPGRVDDHGAVLKSGQFDRLALADPRLAPYGAAAVQVLDRLGLLDTLRPKFVQGDSIAQAYQFVATGNAPMGFVALSQVMVDGRLGSGSAWRVPDHLHEPLRQDALLLKGAEGKPAAAALAAYLKSEPARAHLRSYGYGF